MGTESAYVAALLKQAGYKSEDEVFAEARHTGSVLEALTSWFGLTLSEVEQAEREALREAKAVRKALDDMERQAGLGNRFDAGWVTDHAKKLARAEARLNSLTAQGVQVANMIIKARGEAS
jgi:hypothetical protein